MLHVQIMYRAKHDKEEHFFLVENEDDKLLHFFYR